VFEQDNTALAVNWGGQYRGQRRHGLASALGTHPCRCKEREARGVTKARRPRAEGARSLPVVRPPRPRVNSKAGLRAHKRPLAWPPDRLPTQMRSGVMIRLCLFTVAGAASACGEHPVPNFPFHPVTRRPQDTLKSGWILAWSCCACQGSV
jgi:hypothetical protein